MLYIYVEDEKEGLLLMLTTMKNYYNGNDITVETFNGIFNISEHIKALRLRPNDKAVYIYDDVPGNTDIPSLLKNAKDAIAYYNLNDIVDLVPILCCEYEIIASTYVEIFANKIAISYITELKKHQSKSNLTTDTKADYIFNRLYDDVRHRVRKDLIKDGINPTQNEVEARISVEKLCKEIFKLAFQNKMQIADTFGDCWLTNCDCIDSCHDINKRACNMNLSSANLTDEDKMSILLQNSCSKKSIMQCKNNIETYLQMGQNKAEAKKRCINDGFSPTEIKYALEIL